MVGRAAYCIVLYCATETSNQAVVKGAINQILDSNALASLSIGETFGLEAYDVHDWQQVKPRHINLCPQEHVLRDRDVFNLTPYNTGASQLSSSPIENGADHPSMRTSSLT